MLLRFCLSDALAERNNLDTDKLVRMRASDHAALGESSSAAPGILRRLAEWREQYDMPLSHSEARAADPRARGPST